MGLPRLLLTGASGYIGGPLLDALAPLGLFQIYCLIRTEAQATAVEERGAKALWFNISNAAEAQSAVEDNDVEYVVHLSDAFSFAPGEAFIKGLASVKSRLGRPVHFIHTSGAKLFSEHVGILTPLNDTTDDVYAAQGEGRDNACHDLPKIAVDTCRQVLDLGDALGVHSHVLVPPMCYGPGTGFGNKISIQFVALVRIGLARRQVCETARPTDRWPLCHINDLVSLYVTVLRAALADRAPHGREHGYYFAENETFSWLELASLIARSLHRLELVDTEEVHTVSTDKEVAKLANVLKCPPGLVNFSIGGNCALRGDNGRELGWKPVFDEAHLLATVEDEVAFILKHDETLSHVNS